MNRIGDVMDSVIVSSVVDRGFESRSGKIKDYKKKIYCEIISNRWALIFVDCVVYLSYENHNPMK